MGEMVLIHSGTSGMKHGIRNYRNYDGTLTEEGRRRYNYYERKTDRPYDTGKAKQSEPKTYVKTSRWGESQEDLSRFTNAELKALTERAGLEKSYREAFNTKQYSKGKQMLYNIKQVFREVGDLAQAGKSLIDGMNSIKSSINQVKQMQKQENEKLKNEVKNIEKESNDKAVKDWLLSIEDYTTRNNAMNFIKSFSGQTKGNFYGNISSDQLDKIKKLYTEREKKKKGK